MKTFLCTNNLGCLTLNSKQIHLWNKKLIQCYQYLGSSAFAIDRYLLSIPCYKLIKKKFFN